MIPETNECTRRFHDVNVSNYSWLDAHPMMNVGNLREGASSDPTHLNRSRGLGVALAFVLIDIAL